MASYLFKDFMIKSNEGYTVTKYPYRCFSNYILDSFNETLFFRAMNTPLEHRAVISTLLSCSDLITDFVFAWVCKNDLFLINRKTENTSKDRPENITSKIVGMLKKLNYPVIEEVMFINNKPVLIPNEDSCLTFDNTRYVGFYENPTGNLVDRMLSGYPCEWCYNYSLVSILLNLAKRDKRFVDFCKKLKLIEDDFTGDVRELIKNNYERLRITEKGLLDSVSQR